MSKKYFNKLIEGTGSTTKAVKSKFGAKILADMGWSEGLGLGANKDGMTECIQVTRREEGVGLGGDIGEGESKKKTFQWNDAFWTNMYNKNASKFSDVKRDDDDESESSSSDSEKESDDSSESEIELVIIKAKENYFKDKTKKLSSMTKKDQNGGDSAAPGVDDKSKKIKKDKDKDGKKKDKDKKKDKKDKKKDKKK